jgi:hypothetical protein
MSEDLNPDGSINWPCGTCGKGTWPCQCPCVDSRCADRIRELETQLAKALARIEVFERTPCDHCGKHRPDDIQWVCEKCRCDIYSAGLEKGAEIADEWDHGNGCRDGLSDAIRSFKD